MNQTVSSEDWEELIEVLNQAIRSMAGRDANRVKRNILDFGNSAAMLGLDLLPEVAGQFEDFIVETLVPKWNEEAAATLSFSVGALIEKMQAESYGPQFLAGLEEILLYLTYYEEEAEPTSPAPTEAEAIESPFSTLTEKAPPVFMEEDQPESVAAPAQAAPFSPLQQPVPQPGRESAEEMAREILAHDKPPFQAPAGPETIEVGLHALPEEETGGPEAKITIQAEPFRYDLAEPAPEPEVQLPRARTAQPTGFTGDKIDWYRGLIEHDPTSRIFVLLAEELCTGGFWKEAAEACRKGLVFHPHHLRGRVLLGWALWELGEVQEAERVLSEARRDLEKNRILYKVLARAAENRGDFDQSEHLLNLYASLESGAQENYPRQTSASPGEIAPPSETREPRFIGVLASLLQRFEEAPPPATDRSALFSESDRQDLKRMLRAGTSS